MLKRFLKAKFRDLVLNVVMHEVRVHGPHEKLKLSPHARMLNTLFNTNSGTITVGDYSFAGHYVMVITGRHDHEKLLAERFTYPLEGGDITIGKGVWIGSGAIILGPSTIGDHAVIAAGAVVKGDIPAYAIAAGVPAKVINYVDAREGGEPPAAS